MPIKRTVSVLANRRGKMAKSTPSTAIATSMKMADLQAGFIFRCSIWINHGQKIVCGLLQRYDYIKVNLGFRVPKVGQEGGGRVVLLDDLVEDEAGGGTVLDHHRLLHEHEHEQQRDYRELKCI